MHPSVVIIDYLGSEKPKVDEDTKHRLIDNIAELVDIFIDVRNADTEPVRDNDRLVALAIEEYLDLEKMFNVTKGKQHGKRKRN